MPAKNVKTEKAPKKTTKKSKLNDKVQQVSEDAIRERAYLLWEAAGYPSGDGAEFWIRAEQELQEK